MSNREILLPVCPRYPLGGFRLGLSLPMRAFSYLRGNRNIWTLVAIPVLLNFLLFSATLFWGGGALASWLYEALEGWKTGAAHLAQGVWWQQALHYGIEAICFLLGLLFWPLVMALVYFVFTPMALIISAPFNDVIAERTERSCGFGLPGDDRGLVRTVLLEVLFAIRSEIKRLSFTALIFLMILLLQFIPLIGVVLQPIMTFLWGCLACAFEFTGYASDRRHIPWSVKWRLLLAHKPLVFGFGLATLLLLLVPFVNVFTVPLSAISGTMLFGILLPKLPEEH